MTTQTVTVQFHDQNLTAAMIDGKPYVAMKPICENIGLQWEGQFQRIKRHLVLSSTMCMTHIVAEDGKQREMLMLPLDYLNGWLFGIDVARVKPDIKDRLTDYQRECFQVLADYFMPESRLDLAGLVRENFEALKHKVRMRDCPKYKAPLSLWKPANRIGATAWLTYPELSRMDPEARPTSVLFRQMQPDGHDIEGAVAEVRGIYHLLHEFYWQIDTLRKLFEMLDRKGLNINFRAG
jgi:hypothetical protein